MHAVSCNGKVQYTVKAGCHINALSLLNMPHLHNDSYYIKGSSLALMTYHATNACVSGTCVHTCSFYLNKDCAPFMSKLAFTLQAAVLVNQAPGGLRTACTMHI